jgi:hypothetical protein
LELRNNVAVKRQVKLNAVVPVATRDTIRQMTVQYEATVQRIVAVLIGYGVKNMGRRELRAELAKTSNNGDVKQYRRTKPF